MKKPSIEVLEALVGLEADTRFGVVMLWISATRAELVEQLVECPDPGTAGACRVLGLLLKECADARVNLRRVLDNERKVQ